MQDIIKIAIETELDCPAINSSIAYDKLAEIDNKELLYTLVGIVDNVKQRLNYMIESLEIEEAEAEENESDDLDSDDFKKRIDGEIEDLLNGIE